eukprot:16180305-Heterocapsa_arctica.AAC.1
MATSRLVRLFARPLAAISRRGLCLAPCVAHQASEAMAFSRDLCTHPCRTAHRREPAAPRRRTSMVSSASTSVAHWSGK